MHPLLGNYSPSNELTVFRKNFALLCTTVADIDALLLHFVAENIINIQQQENILSYNTTSEKISRLLLSISGPLEAGDSKGFYTMLKIMRRYGVDATVRLADNIFASIDMNPAEMIHEDVTKG